MHDVLIDHRYRLIESIGSGGEARVFRARDETSGTEVALRLAHQPGARAVAEEAPPFHDGWVRLLATGSDAQSGAYQVFELLQGQTLGQLISSAPLDPQGWRDFVQQSLGAVEALHDVNWVHGDLNADNFFRTAEGWKLLELPFLRPVPAQGRSTMFGSIHTLAPEQLNGKSPDFRSDLYSLGCLYYFAAAGAYPHPGPSAQDVAIHCLRFAAEPLDDRAPSLPAAWTNWVMTLIAPHPNDRFPSIAAARQLLEVA